MAATGFSADVPYRLIESVRLVHALMESRYRVHVPAEHEDKFSRLREVFGADFTVGVAGVPQLSGLAVSHAEPLTSIGSLQRPLIFPHAIVQHCRRLWASHRDVRVSFAGLITDKRRAVLDEWARFALPGVRTGLGRRTLLDRVTARLRRMLRHRSAGQRVETNGLTIWPSQRGRQFPGKSWDADYQALLARSRFVLCPSGDFVWLYRFFEAALCGAIPIIEQDCAAYAGFRYRTMTEALGDADWNEEEALHNYALCQERLTVSRAALDAELESLLMPHITAGAN